MTALREFLSETAPFALPAGGFVIGLLFGAVIQRWNFCAMGAVSDAMTFRDWRRARAWLLAAGIAVLGTQGLAAAGLVDLSRSMYLGPSLNWAGHLFGGVMFGIGMVLAGGCTSRNLARAGSGDLRSALTLVVLAIFAYMTTGGILGPLRAELEASTAVALGSSSQSLSELSGAFGQASALSGIGALPFLVAGLLITVALASRSFRCSRAHWVSGLGAGLLVVAGWSLTGLAYDEMADRVQPPVSLTFVKPTADTVEWLERFTAQGLPTFAVATVLGVLAGAFLAALAGGRLKLATFADASDTIRHLAGAALMGSGGVMALGCTVGQGLTGVSTLSLGSFLSAAAIVAGAVMGLKGLERWTS